MQKILGKTVADRLTAYDLISFMQILPNPDPVLTKLGKRISAYDDLLYDTQVRSCLSSRKAGVAKLKFELEGNDADQKIVDFIQKTFDRFNYFKLFKQILGCVAYGYQPIEIDWEVREGRIVPARIEEKPAEWFCFGEKNELRFRSKKHPVNGEELPEMKFVCPTNDATYKNPYGTSVLSLCFWPATFKKGNLKFWVTFTEKYGSPWLIGKYAPGTEKKVQNELGEQLENMVQDAIAVIPDTSKIEIIEAAGKSASADIFDKLKDACNADISKAILGQTLTTELGSTGSLAAAQTHNEVRKDIILSDARIIEETLNQIVRWTIDQNFGKDVIAPAFRFSEHEEVNKQLAERDAILAGIGVRFKPKYIQRAYNLGEDDFEVVETSPLNPLSDAARGNGFSAPLYNGEGWRFSAGVRSDSLDRAARAAFPPEKQQELMEKILAPVFDLIEKGTSLEEIYDRLGEMLPELDTDELRDILDRACSAADMFGNAGGKI
jgi:phage gp29-like protein